MGLAPYGKPVYDLSKVLKINKGVPFLNKNYLNDQWRFVSFHCLEPRISKKLSKDLNFIKRIPGDLIRKDKNMAASAQNHLEDSFKLIKFNLKRVNSKNLILTGGVALNSKLCGLIDELTLIDKFYVPQLPSDGNLALGAAIQAMPIKERFSVYSKKPYFSFKYTSKEISNAIKLTGNKIQECNISLVNFKKR